MDAVLREVVGVGRGRSRPHKEGPDLEGGKIPHHLRKQGWKGPPNINLWVLLEKLHTHSVPLKYVLISFSTKLSFDDLLI